MDIKTKANRKFITRNASGEENGFLVPIINVYEDFIDSEEWPKQVYCTVAAPWQAKGPHLHKKRQGLFTCIKGDILIVMRIDGKYVEHFSGENYEFRTVQLPAGIPAALVNISDTDAYILNMPSPAWHVDDQDDWDVEFNDYDFEKVIKVYKKKSEGKGRL